MSCDDMVHNGEGCHRVERLEGSEGAQLGYVGFFFVTHRPVHEKIREHFGGGRYRVTTTMNSRTTAEEILIVGASK